MIVPRRHVALISAAMAGGLAVAGCACNPWSGARTITGPSGQTLCAMHHVPLITARAYRAPYDACILMTPGWGRAAQCYPNHISPRTSLRSGGKLFITPVTIHYCPVCERELEKEADRLD